MSSEETSIQQAESRLKAINSEASQLKDSVAQAYENAHHHFEKVIDELRRAREAKSDLADLKAETTFLRLSHDLDVDEPKVPEASVDDFQKHWKQAKTTFQPVRASKKWLDKIRSVDTQPKESILTEEELLELERRLKDNVCPICVSFALDGTCTLQAFEKCPIDTYLSRLVKMIEEMGHRPWMEDYFEKMYREICPGCSGRVDEDYCPPREDGECAMFTYLPTIVRTIENFMKEKREAENL